MFKFLHAADLHLDTQPSGLYGYPPDVAEVLRDASLESFRNLVDTAISEQVAFCIFAGDIYDGADRGTRAELEFRTGLKRLATAGIRSFIAHGNHDPVEQGWSTVDSWPEEVTVFGTSEPDTARFTIDGTTLAVHGISYARSDTTDNLASRFRRDRHAQLQLGVLHTNVGNDADHAPYAPCSVEDLRSVGLDYWALGHIHKRQSLREGDPWIQYPGNLQGRSPKPSEQGAKGAVLVTVGDAATISEVEFVALDVLRFVSCTVDVDDLDDLGDLEDALCGRAEELREQHPSRALVIRATVAGRGPVHSMLRRGGSAEGLLASLRDAWASHSPALWWDRLVDRTRPAVDLTDLEQQDDFLGDALRAVRRGANSGEGGEDDPLAVLNRLAPSPERLGVTLPDPNDPDLVERARLLTADLLSGGES